MKLDGLKLFAPVACKWCPHTLETGEMFCRVCGIHRWVPLRRWQVLLGLILVIVGSIIFLWFLPGMIPPATPEPTAQSTLEPTNYTAFSSTFTPIPTPTKRPTSTSTPKAISTTTPKATPTTTPTATSTPSPTIEPVCVVPGGVFKNLWQNYKKQLGCPIQNNPQLITVAEQYFENGTMFWWKHVDTHYVVYQKGALSGTYQVFPDTWIEGEPMTSCNVSSPPSGLLQPLRGFGRVWCALGAENASLGWALAQESGFEPGNADPLVQNFEKGIIFRDSNGTMTKRAYILFDDGTFLHVAY